jgi:hypothetical protein
MCEGCHFACLLATGLDDSATRARQIRGGTLCRRCWWVLDVAAWWVCFPVMMTGTQGRLAEAQLTLGYIPQLRWSWCAAERSGEDCARLASYCWAGR